VRRSSAMDKAAIGIQVHSGWGALVAVASVGGALFVIHRARLEIIGNEIPGWKQPYHFAEKLDLPEARQHLGKCAAASSQLATKALRDVVEQLQAEKKRLIGSAILLGSGRPLPPLSSILRAHPLIHTAEGEFFRRIFWEACCQLGVAAVGFRAKDLDACATAVLGKAAKTRVERNIQTLGKSIGPPWTSDQKNAALAAALLLLGEKSKVRACSQEPASLTIS
jgi:hypothetical protein